MLGHQQRALSTCDDFLLTPQRGVVPSRDPAVIDLTAAFSEHVMLNRPLVSANMDTITRAAMAVVLAEEGGIGVIDREFRVGDIAPQGAEIASVNWCSVKANPNTSANGKVLAGRSGGDTPLASPRDRDA